MSGLDWPRHRPRTPANRRKRGKFSTRRERRAGLSNYSYRSTEPVTIAEAIERLDYEIDRLGGRYPRISTELETRLDGRPRSGQRAPDDPGAAVYFSLEDRPIAFACDTFNDVAQNIAAMAAHIESVRKQVRYGVATAAEMFQAFEALPPPGAATRPPNERRAWHAVLGVYPDADDQTIKAAYRSLAKKYHPDVAGRPAGSDDKWREISDAYGGALFQPKESQ